MNYRLASAVAAVLAACPTYAVRAQTSEPSSGKLEEIIVTAQRREESLQDVPLAIQALTGETLSPKPLVRYLRERYGALYLD